MMKSRAYALLVSLLLLPWGCSSPSRPISIVVRPSQSRVHVGGSIQLTATVANSDNTAVSWRLGGDGCSGATCGTITDSGLYTAPATVPNPPLVRVTASSVADPSKSYNVIITVLAHVEITVTPADPTLSVGRSLQFTAEVRNADDPRVVWSVSGAGCTGDSCGTVSTTGLYTAPAIVPSSPTVTIAATSVEDPEQSGAATALIALKASSIEWGWMAGPQNVDIGGTYGTIGVPSPTVSPGARQGAAAWSDSGGGLWLFGGYGYAQVAAQGYLDDLWRFDPATGQWT
jgi:hypothetical protein